MKTTLKKKLTAAILAGCSTFILSGVALANPPQPPPPPPTELAQRPTPPPKPFVHNEEVQNYCTQFESDYSWMYRSTREDAARDFVSVDKALERNTISTNQATKLKKEIISFYKDRQKYEDKVRKLDRRDAREYRQENREHFSLRANIADISESTTIPVDTLKRILFKPNPKAPKDRDDLSERLAKFTNQLVVEGKITQQEVDILDEYMQSGRDKLANMTKEERREYLADYRQLTDEQRLAKISEGTGISPERLQQIFTAFKEAVKDKLQTKIQD
ncbi:hypothetical protein H5995_05615 [Megamonas rupellensis]|uniref:hypothetical protein n=1 Tax=Megamonas rupellensis TaxID=491921 RepID=UPI001957816F|nr:hypothetical protein [Megamonas rupellensis]MBM6748758.1 hypothetical protein [Megamonas rupellensis]